MGLFFLCLTKGPASSIPCLSLQNKLAYLCPLILMSNKMSSASLPLALQPNLIPRHVAIIMDGNGRWAQKQGEMRLHGHRNAITAVRDSAEYCAELGVEWLTLYAFSTENWGRPKAEVEGLMELLVHTIRLETETLQKNNIRLATIGDTEGLPPACQAELKEAIDLTAENARMTLTLALNYSGRWDITQAVQKLAVQVKDGSLQPESISEHHISKALSTAAMPDPELLIRTSGEKRISNFLLWEIAYSELYITDVLWPDFDKVELEKALLDYQQRDRRFGKVNTDTYPSL
jgi:undecaprenyl diphosphate synthase